MRFYVLRYIDNSIGEATLKREYFAKKIDALDAIKEIRENDFLELLSDKPETIEIEDGKQSLVNWLNRELVLKQRG